MGIHVKVAAFEGPLDALLHLIEAAQVDITDIPLADIASQFLEAVSLMQELEIEVASQYLVIAAQLLAIKSRRLLPPEPREEEDDSREEEEQLQQLLLERLLEYRRFKNAAAELKQREKQQRYLFTRPPHPQWVEVQEPLSSSQQLQLQHTLEELAMAYVQASQRTTSLPPEPSMFIRRRRITVQAKLQHIIRRLRKRESVTFWELITVYHRQEMIVTFLALLELLKMSRIKMEQRTLFGDITIARRPWTDVRRPDASQRSV